MGILEKEANVDLGVIEPPSFPFGIEPFGVKIFHHWLLMLLLLLQWINQIQVYLHPIKRCLFSFETQ
jgi:hypothetical protein